MKFFVTGHLGYIGVHLVDLLKQAGHTVTGCDLNLFEGCAWEPFVRPDRELIKDVRDVTPEDLDGHDCVMHLAAISNDPMGDLDPQITLGVNRDASIELARKARAAGVGRFLFSGSCSVYGAGSKLDLEESDPLNPLTAYAKSKIETEQGVAELADDGFTPAYLRNATAYGHSPMLRVDLVVNNLLGSALSYGQIRIKSDGTPWRPLLHCRDIALAFTCFAEAPRENIHNRAINVGWETENYQVKDVADQVGRLIPNAEIVFTGEVGEDPRNYRVRFDRLRELVPAFRPKYDLVSGMEELHRKMVEHGFGKADFEGKKFVRLRTLRERLHKLESARSESSALGRVA
jgi:nucleoside-diphosphate-sugar epimerase